MLVLGVDEAGYGPTLGPLCVAGAAFRVPTGGPSLADGLARAVAAPGARRNGRLVVGDSKEVYGPTHDPARLELPVLAFLAARDGTPPRNLAALLAALGTSLDDPGGGPSPWYGPSAALPLWTTPGDVASAADALRGALADAGASFEGFAAAVVPERPLNAALEAAGNKSDVLFSLSADVFDRLAARATAGEEIRAVMDRQGGRRFYLPPMHARWPQRFAWALDEGREVSRYRMRVGESEAEIAFAVGGDGEALQTGLASMCAKYLREASMRLWNEWFAARCPGVAPTAGYAVDARRWLDETRTARLALGVPDERLVRVR
ncbi:MAG: hypothetical protein HMLKMBBP_01785 [Planctomycetes bacterium]|nr:hypothetical protein [Planctomycetota bacterium]